MNLEDIIYRAQHLYSAEDLLSLINDIKKEELGDKSHTFTIGSIKYYSNPNKTHLRYHTFEIPKKNGSVRIIYAPNATLKNYQYYLNIILKALYKPSDNAMGFTEGKSVITNAQRHICKRYVYNIDLKDFFTNITQARVWKRLQLPPFNFKQPVVNIIAGICSIKLFPSESYGRKSLQYVLPQGAPTSPLLSNAICDVLDRRLNGLAKRFNAEYTRYADDITFSSNKNVFNTNSDFILELNRLISEQGFSINLAKTRLQIKGSRQEVTGLTVSDKVNVSRKYVRSIRQVLYIWERYGFFEAEKKYKEYSLGKKNNLLLAIKGKLEFLKMVKGETDSVYIKLNTKFEVLKNASSKEVGFITTVSLKEFEKEFGILTFRMNERGKKYAYYKLYGRYPRFLSVSNRINITDLNKDLLFVSKCRRRNGSTFRLIHFPRVEKS